MRLDNEFVVPRPVDEAWAVLTDVELIAPCLPGAQLTEVTGDDYHGNVKVKVGPVVAQYAGVARFRELDAAAHRAVLEAKGKERNGRGMASALVTAELLAEGEQTRVRVGTDLTISGPLAQFGRGAIAEVSGRLLNQFVDRLRDTVLAQPRSADPAATSAAPATDAPATAVTVGDRPAEPTPGDAGSPTPAGDSPARPAAGPATTTVNGAAATRPPDSGARRTLDGPEAAPADLLKVAALPILKRVAPLLAVIAVAVVVIVVATR
nr:SRPBCC family protein [Micromonospora sp. DSM 115978]